jgi:hypothetical protein
MNIETAQLEKALILNGGGYGKLPDNLTAGVMNSTVEFWVQWNRLENWSRVIDFGKEGNAFVICNEKDTSSLLFRIYDKESKSHTIRLRKVIKLKRWYHIAVVSGSGGMKIYVDGQLKGSDTYTGGMGVASGGTNYIGRSNWVNDAPFSGCIAELRIWNVQKAAGDIIGNMSRVLVGDEPGLVGYWRFAEMGQREEANLVSNTTFGNILLSMEAKIGPVQGGPILTENIRTTTGGNQLDLKQIKEELRAEMMAEIRKGFMPVGKDQNLEIKILSIKSETTFKGNNGKQHQSGDGRRFIIIEMQVENLSDRQLSDFSPYVACQLIDSEGFISQVSNIHPVRSLPTLSVFSKGLKVKGSIVFDIEDSTDPQTLIWIGFPDNTNIEIKDLQKVLSSQ